MPSLPCSLKRVAVAALKKQTKPSQLPFAELQRNKNYFISDALKSNSQTAYPGLEVIGQQPPCKPAVCNIYNKTKLHFILSVAKNQTSMGNKELVGFFERPFRDQYENKAHEKTLLCSASPWTLALSAVLSFAVFCEGTRQEEQLGDSAVQEKQSKFRALIDDLQSDNMESAQGALKSLLSLVKDSSNHELLVNLGIATALVNVLSRANEEARRMRQVSTTSSGETNSNDNPACLDTSQIVFILAQLSQSTCSHNALMEANVMSPVCELLQDLGWKISNDSSKTFSWLPQWLSFGKKHEETKNRNKQESDSSIPRVASTVALSSQENVVGSPSSLYFHDERDNNMSLSRKSLALSQNPERKDQQKSQITNSCIQLVSHLARNPKCIDRLVESPIIYPLLDIVQHEEEDVITRREALLTVASLAKSNSKIVLKSGALSVLIERAESKDSQLSSYAVGALLNAMKHGDIDIHRQFMKEQGHQKLIQICKTTDKAYEQSRIFAVLVLGELLKTSHPKGAIIRQKLLQSGVIDAWKDILMHSHEEPLLKNVCKVLWLCGQNATSREVIAKEMDEKTLEKLVLFLDKSFGTELSCASLFALSSFVNDEKVKLELAKQEHLIESIVPLLHLSSNISTAAVSILSSLSSETACQKELCKANCLTALLKVPTTPSNSQCIVQLLANLSKNEACRVNVAHEGGLSLLLKFANSKDETLRKEAARALYNLCRPGVTRTMVVQAGALRTLVSLVASTEDPVTSKYAIGCLSSIAESFENVPRLAELGVAGLLVRKISNTSKPSKEMIRYSVLCIAEMANIMEIHSLLAESGVIPLLLSCCASRDLETQQYALMALCNLSATESVRPLLKQHGANRILGIVLRSAMPLPEIQGMAAAILANLKGEQNMIHIQPLSPMAAA